MMLTMLRRGVSLVEVLVVTGLMTLLTLILTEIYFASYKVFEHGSAHTDIQQRCRETVNRIVPLIMGASEPALTQDAVYLPDNVDASRGSELWFYSPDDLFGNAVYDPRNPVFYFYRVRQLSGDVVLEKLAMNGTTLASPPPRVLGKAMGDLTFERIDTGLVQIEVAASAKVRGAVNRERTIDTKLRTTVSIPFYTSQ